MKTRKILLTVSVCVMLFLMSAASAFAATPKVYINGNLQNFEVNPVIEDGVTLVPVRAIFEELGAVVSWKEDTKQIKGEKDDTTVKLYLNSRVAYVDLDIYLLDVAPKTIKNRTMVPLRFVSEALDCNVNWDEKTSTITIDYNNDAGGGKPEPSGVSLDRNSAVIAKGEYVYLTAELIPAGIAPSKIIWSSSDEDVASVGKMGRVRGEGVGTAVITAETENGYSDTCVVKVTKEKDDDSNHHFDSSWGSGNISKSQYYKNLGLKNYTAVTGDKCQLSIDKDWVITAGFADKSVIYYYDYRKSSFEKYHDYLVDEEWQELVNLDLKGSHTYVFTKDGKLIEYKYNKLTEQVIVKIISDGTK